jgi:hypothetical protein
MQFTSVVKISSFLVLFSSFLFFSVLFSICLSFGSFWVEGDETTTSKGELDSDSARTSCRGDVSWRGSRDDEIVLREGGELRSEKDTKEGKKQAVKQKTLLGNNWK